MSRSPGIKHHIFLLFLLSFMHIMFFYVLHAMLLMFIDALWLCVLAYCDDVLYLYSNTMCAVGYTWI